MIELVYTVCASKEEARMIGKSLVREKRCACVNIIPGMESFYFWEGELVEDHEVVLLIKSIQGSFTDLANRIKELHSYDVPAIFSLAFQEADKQYLAWVNDQVK